MMKLGNTVFRSYDPFGRVVAEWGATYPARYTYDTVGRRTSLSTTRDGVTWDTTTWAYDAPTGNCISKTYADGSTVTYTYTPDSLPLRTTYASGRWKENVYDAKRQVVGVIYSDGESGSFSYDEFGNDIAASNDVSSVVSLRSEQGDCTNETAIVGNESKTTVRAFDEHRRLTEIDGTIYEYNPDGLLASISNDIALVEYAYDPDLLDAGCTLTLSNGVVFSRSLVRDDFRRSLVAGIANTGGGATTESLAYAYDALNRPASRNGDTFGYNERSEVTAATIMGGSPSPATAFYEYDDIGNLLQSALNATTNTYSADNLNQYTLVGCVAPNAPPCAVTPAYDIDGNMTGDGIFSFTYDAANRLKTVSSNGVLIVANFYDAKSRRVKKVTQEATMTFFYDGWNLVEERIAYTNGTSSTIHYYWGKDLSGTLQGAGGVGGLLYLTINDMPYIPTYDNNGNITRYLDANGNTIAQYVYDAFGNLISKSGPLADFFRHRFSTKYFDVEADLYYFDYRFYSPPLMRWLNRDPIEERGGENLYAFCENNAISKYDAFGHNVILTSGNRNASWWQIGNRFLHQEICVDTWNWNKKSCCWRREGRLCFSFMAIGLGFGSPGDNWLGMSSIKGPGILRGEVYSTGDQGLEVTETLETTVCQDMSFLAYLISLDGKNDTYSVARHSCRTFSQAMFEEAKRRSVASNGGCKNGKKCE